MLFFPHFSKVPLTADVLHDRDRIVNPPEDLVMSLSLATSALQGALLLSLPLIFNVCVNSDQALIFITRRKCNQLKPIIIIIIIVTGFI